MELSALDDKLSQLNALRPLDASSVRALRSVFESFETELIAASNQIEGNTLTVRETAMVIEKGMTISGKPLKDHIEALNHKAALDYIKQVGASRTAITQKEVLRVHELILTRLDDEWAGRYRNVPVRIVGSTHLPPNALKVSDLMDDWEREAKGNWSATHPVLLAADLNATLAGIHPFIDGNGRTSRLVMNLTLLRHGWHVIVIPSESTLRLAYYQALEDTQTGKHPNAFREFICQRVDDMLDRYLDALK
jgi:Fic family protein